MYRPKLLVDTHYLIWDILGHIRCTPDVQKTMKKYGDELYVSSISFWEIGLLVGKGRIKINTPVDVFCEDILRYRNYKRFNISPLVAKSVATMANEVNGDPADRILVATALVHNATLLTADQNLKNLNFIRTV